MQSQVLSRATDVCPSHTNISSLSSLRSSDRVRGGHIQLLAMSATVGNIQDLAHWLHAELFVTDFRPVKLVERVVAAGEMFDVDAVPVPLSSSPLVPPKTPPSSVMLAALFALCAEAVAMDQQVLVFCATKLLCQETCKFLSSEWKELGSMTGGFR